MIYTGQLKVPGYLKVIEFIYFDIIRIDFILLISASIFTKKKMYLYDL